MNKFDKTKIYVFDIDKYKKDMKKRIKKAKNEYDKEFIKETLRDGLNGFAKELTETNYTFSLLEDKSGTIGLYTYNGENLLIYPQWCKEITVEELGKRIEKKKGNK